MGLRFEVDASDIPERRLPDESPPAFARRLALLKAQAVANREGRRCSLVVGADTIVVLDAEVLGKPADSDEAMAMLRRLCGRQHTVYTGLGLVCRSAALRCSLVAGTSVHMAAYDDRAILEYVSGGDPLDKAGAYGIQADGFAPVARLEGCYANVMGLPMCHLYRALSGLGMAPPAHPLDTCPLAVAQGCPWSRAITEAPVDLGACIGHGPPNGTGP